MNSVTTSVAGNGGAPLLTETGPKLANPTSLLNRQCSWSQCSKLTWTMKRRLSDPELGHWKAVDESEFYIPNPQAPLKRGKFSVKCSCERMRESGRGCVLRGGEMRMNTILSKWLMIDERWHRYAFISRTWVGIWKSWRCVSWQSINCRYKSALLSYLMKNQNSHPTATLKLHHRHHDPQCPIIPYVGSSSLGDKHLHLRVSPAFPFE